MIKKIFFAVTVLLWCSIAGHARQMPGQEDGVRESVTLAGIWQFKLDPMNVAIPVKGAFRATDIPVGPITELGELSIWVYPALRGFPTAFHSDWQWFDLVRYSQPMLLDHTPARFRPVVQMIPDWNNNRKIGLVIEARVGKGRLLMTSIDLMGIRDKSPVARQMLSSLERYVAGDEFAPGAELTTGMIDKLFKTE